MKQLTENQITKINEHLSRMTEAQQDSYIQKLEEAGLLKNILSSFGSAKNNVAKLQKQKTQISTQIDNIIKAINASQVQGISPQDKQGDVKALTDLKAKLDAINLNIQVPDEAPAPNVDNGGNQAGNQGSN